MKDPWYKEGLKFECQKNCCNCCSKFPGYTWLTLKDELRIADFFKISLDEFRKRYCRFVKGRLSLKENYRNFDCVFIKDNKCSIYAIRPIQCSAFPFWPNNLSSKEAFDSLEEYCPGCNKGKHHSFDEINKILNEFIQENS
ncbi:MAG: YkgJ family cysteine cluster protein [Chlamydiae bacterium]|nr:YkgJ family cysteine cluster protein [Chlamydiota bacterium]